MNAADAITIDDLRRAAKRRLPRLAFDFIEGGVEDEHCLVRNEEAFARFRFLPRYFVDVSRRSQTATLFGETYASPFGVSPSGMADLWRPKADEMLARAAAAANIPFILSCASNSSVESIVALAAKNVWFQFYAPRDHGVGERIVGRVRDSGVETLVVTADVPVSPSRERNMRNRFERPLRLSVSIIIDGCRHPRWLWGYMRAGGQPPLMPMWAPHAEGDATPDEVARFFAAQVPAPDHTWKTLEQYRKLWPGKLVVKGILHPLDALRAADQGVDGIIVSNHGGRQLDYAPSPLEALPAIHAAVGNRLAIMLDSGARRGADILTALCLGAQFVFVGRPTLYGVAAFGLPGAQRAIDILRRGIDINMAQIGCADLRDVGPHFIMNPMRAGGGDLSREETARTLGATQD